ncbi:long-chain fatty acid transport protein 1 isoform X2 [Ceratitis capitata]|uniref:long-chain fatty acid transport protein 1 isoform X2 n=1 Tax=Ceratitis capitata TaxID=7213 RepID=UPI000329E223|nr:long-chain fatty acid transport protein 1 isoform X2 [Ceratitis capitata]
MSTSIKGSSAANAVVEQNKINGTSHEGFASSCFEEDEVDFKRTEKEQCTAAHIAINVDGDKQNHTEKTQRQSQNVENGKQHSMNPNSTSELTVATSATSNKSKLLLVGLTVSTTSVIVAILWYFCSWKYGLPALIAAIFATTLVAVGWRWFYIALVTTQRDVTALWAYIRLLVLIKRYERNNVSVGDIFQMNVEKYPDKLVIVSETQSWTFRQLDQFANRIADLFHSHGFKKGDVIGLLLENRAEFVGMWLGLSKLGITIALVNTNLTGASLVHCIVVAKCSAFIYGEDFEETIEGVATQIPPKLYQFNNAINKPVRNSAADLATLMNSTNHVTTQPSAIQHPNHHDRLMYIYTSGTTGLPKAAVISHSRYIFISAAIHYTLGFKSKDIFYTPLPLYHTAGGIMSIGQAIVFGATVAIRKKFSASGYFADCVRFNCTIAQYIGEMARYILATPESDYDRAHQIRLVFGNGLRPQIWTRFVERFNIPRVGEFYGATEGNANIVNNDNTVGAIGFVSRIIPQIYPISIIKANPDTGEPIRDAKGLCQRCAPNEAGVFIGQIIKGNPTREFLGYADESASTKKIVHDVFKKGDMAFLSGDLLTSDERGYLYFMDRTGDTFRWKGENVSTGEVESQVSNIASYKDSIVYGVLIPHTEGRAGMAAIYDPQREVDLERFACDIAKVLPAYARPQFIRFLTEIDLTGTFKLRKVDLQKDGYNPNNIQDEIYYQTASGKYELLTVEVYEKINNGEIRF